MKKRIHKKLDRKGFTLVEVLVAFTILLMASQILLLGISFRAKMEKRSSEIEELGRGIGEHLMDKSMCMPGTVRLDLREKDGDIEAFGWLYSGEDELNDLLQVIWMDEGHWLELDYDRWSEEAED